jgi:hypothetical protein
MFLKISFLISCFGQIIFYFFYYYEKSILYKKKRLLQIPFVFFIAAFLCDAFFVQSLPLNNQIDWLIGGVIAHGLIRLTDFFENFSQDK